MKKEENLYIPKEIYKKTERALYGYYDDEKEIKNISAEVEMLESNICEIEEDIKNTNIKIDYYQNGVSISERVQTSSLGISFAEREICNAIEKLENEHAMKTRRLLKLKKRLRKIKEKNSRMKLNLEMLENDLQMILKYKYSDKKSVQSIALALNYSNSTAGRRKDQLVLNVAQFIHLV